MLLQSSSSTSFITNLVFMGLLLLVMYLFFIRPQAKKQKAQQGFVDQLQKGDDVVTASGIVGKITKLDDQIVTLQISQKGFIDVLRSTVSKEMTESYKKE